MLNTSKAFFLAALFTLTACNGNHAADHADEHAGEHADGHGHGHAEAPAADYERGPHGGRMLRDGDFALEVKIFEDGVPPEYHLYGYEKDVAIPPSRVQATVELRRLGGRIDTFAFTPMADFLRGNGVVVEPHSFDVSVRATHAGKRHAWAFASYEGRTVIPAEIARLSGLVVVRAGGAVIREQLDLTGTIQAFEDRTANAIARFPGVVREARKQVGERVSQGEVIARVQSNESLETYSVLSPIAGVVVERSAQVGAATGDAPLYVLTNLSTVRAELDVYGADLARIRTGQKVAVRTATGELEAEGTITRIAPVASRASQSVRAQVTLANADARWRPGQFVQGRVVIAEHAVPLAVRNTGLQQFRDFTVVFARVGNTYEVRMLELGRKDHEWTEVLGGLAAGETYVTDNSFLVKADVEKTGASHDH